MYTRDLTIGDTGADVTALQQFLLADGMSIPARATGYFGAQTRSALVVFQKANGISPSTGYFGPLTRAFVVGKVTIPATTSNVVPSAKSLFTRSLKQGDIGPDILALQQFLNTQGFVIAGSGPGSPGNETDYFGPATYQAVLKFQTAYKDQILSPLGLSTATGYVGSSTIAKIKALSDN